MKKLFCLGMATGFVFCSAVVLADRTDIWSASTVSVRKVELTKLPDAGCAVQAFATFVKQDGGITNEGSALVEVSGANRTSCLDILDVKASALFKADKGL